MAFLDRLSQFAFWKPTNRFCDGHYKSSDGLSLYYRDYPGPSDCTPVLCIPGLTRNARDFDFIAAHIAQTRRVLVADLRGRGKSERAKDPRHYTVAIEAADIMRLLDEIGLRRVVVLGTSRGGIVAMTMAATRPASIEATVLNDIGGEIEAKGLARILEFMGREPPIPNWWSAAEGLRRVYGTAFPTVSFERWKTFARAIYKEEGGKIVPDYDQRMGDAMRQASPNFSVTSPNVMLWPLFGALGRIPTLVVMGENSDLLSVATLSKMHAAKADLKSVVVANRGHAPFLDEPEAVTAIASFLNRIA
jgi:pimeloyl-ACP methyl ester carboxylesterase